MKKALVIGIILLFIGASGVLTIATNLEKINRVANCDIEVFYPTDDTEISHDLPDTVLGNFPGLVIRNEYGAGGSPGWAEDGLLKFDISSIPTEAFVKSASLYLFYWGWGSTNPQGRELNLYRITSDWDEETTTWNNQPTYYTSPSTSSFIPDDINNWIQWNVTSDVQKYVDGQLINYGWKITDENYWGESDIPMTRLRAKENVTYCPYLEIDFILPNHPPDKPDINGPTTVKVGDTNTYTIVAIDPDDDNILYEVDWGDGVIDDWYGPVGSNVVIQKSHSWEKKGDFIIKIRAKDIYGAIGNWSSMTITAPCSYNKPFLPFLERFFERFPNAFPILRHLMGY